VDIYKAGFANILRHGINGIQLAARLFCTLHCVDSPSIKNTIRGETSIIARNHWRSLELFNPTTRLQITR
jgi:hypothetical protein